ncbi:MAG: hypothetical protein HQK65_15785 [Desulfamplus sp.]|nr:hypothetical protein [Desulfamplus sp.]
MGEIESGFCVQIVEGGVPSSTPEENTLPAGNAAIFCIQVNAKLLWIGD